MGKNIKQDFFLKKAEKKVINFPLMSNIFKNNNKKAVATVHRLVPRGRLLTGTALSPVKGVVCPIKTIKKDNFSGWELPHLPKDEL